MGKMQYAYNSNINALAVGHCCTIISLGAEQGLLVALPSFSTIIYMYICDVFMTGAFLIQYESTKKRKENLNNFVMQQFFGSNGL